MSSENSDMKRDLERDLEECRQEVYRLKALAQTHWEKTKEWVDEKRALKSRIADLEAANRWIPVKERLPDDNDLVLVFNEFGAVDMAYFRGGFKTFAAVIVTHWRPQPAPPQGTQS